MELIDKDELIFKISIEWVQQESNDIIGRNLSDDELDTVKKCIEWGLLTDIDTVFKTAIFEATKYSQI